jgi:integrase
VFEHTTHEIDDLLTGCGKKIATFLQLLKKTGVRAGEALRLKWIDLDFQREDVVLNERACGEVTFNAENYTLKSVKSLLAPQYSLVRVMDCEGHVLASGRQL